MNAGKATGRLGRGLEALLGEEPLGSAPSSRADVSLSAIEANPYQPRTAFDDDDLEALKESISNLGILQPLVVRQMGDRYQLIAGERRLRAAQLAGLDQVPVTIVDFNDQQSFEAALVENIQRSDLNAMDKATGFRDYLARYEMTHDQLAARLGMGRTTITNFISLLDLPGAIQEKIRTGELSSGHGKALKSITDPQKQLAMMREVVSRGMSVRATEEFISTMGATAEPEEKESAAPSAPRKTRHVQSVEDDLKRKLGLKVEIKVKGKDKGQVVLSFETNDDFERLVSVLGK